MNLTRWQPAALLPGLFAVPLGAALSHGPFTAGGLLLGLLDPELVNTGAGNFHFALVVVATVTLESLFLLLIWTVQAPLLAGRAAIQATPVPAGLCVLGAASLTLALDAALGWHSDALRPGEFAQWAASSTAVVRWLSGVPAMVCLAALFNFTLIALTHPASPYWTAITLRPRHGWRHLTGGVLTILAFLLLVGLLSFVTTFSLVFVLELLVYASGLAG